MEEVKKKEKRELQPIWKILIILVVMVVGIVGVLLTVKYIASKSNSIFYNVQFSSVEDKGTNFYAVINIETNNYIEIVGSDFSVMVGEIPISADGIIDDSSYITISENKVSLNGNKTIKIYFKKSLDDIDKPITIRYKGKSLTLGVKTVFEY